MRTATSAMTAASGLCLLGLAIFGQPEVYLREIHQQWSALLGGGTTAEDRDPAADALEQRVAQLQQQLTQLRGQLAEGASRTGEPAQPVTGAARLGEGGQQPAVTSPTRVGDAGQPSGAAVPAAVGEAGQRSAQGSARAGDADQPPVAALGLRAAEAVPDPLVGSPTRAGERVQPPAAPTRARPDRPAQQLAMLPDQPAVLPPARLDTPPQTSGVSDRRDATKALPLPPVPRSRPDATTPKPDVAAARPDTTAPRPDVPTARPDADDVESVVARLRQRTNVASRTVEPQSPIDRPPLVRSPSVQALRQRLVIAQDALLNGHIDDARRQLQEVQLRLVFRPVGPADDDAPPAGRSAVDVAHALDALGANDARLCARFIERAMNDIAGTPSRLAEPEMPAPAAGYAPPYPQR